jgi:hypothetical protein
MQMRIFRLNSYGSTEFHAGFKYNELGGIQDGGSGNPTYTAKLQVLDGDFPQYIHDNTDDEITHFTFLNGYLKAKGAAPVSLEQFRTLPGSTATGSSGKPRLTNLMQLTLDTSWWTRYRSSTHNPDLDPNFKFPQAVPDLSKGQFTAIPRTDADLSPDAHIQAIANTAGFHLERVSALKSSKQAPIGWHTLRRSLATLLISNGENVKVAQSQLRHTTPKITLELYAQAVSADQQKAHKKVVQMVLPAKFPEKLKARSAAPTA